MSIDQLPSGNWRARVMVDRQRYTATFQTRREAGEWLLLAPSKAATGELAPRMTVEQYVQRWLDSTAATPVADRNRYRMGESPYCDRLSRSVSDGLLTLPIARTYRGCCTQPVLARLSASRPRCCA